MYDSPVCRVGGFCLVVGGLAISGWWLAAVTVGVVALGAFAIRTAFRRGKRSNES